MTKIAFIGMGEAGSALITGWGIGTQGVIRAYDKKSDDPRTRDGLEARYKALGVQGCSTAAEAVAEADLVISVVTADQAVLAAQSVAGHLPKGAYFCDLNSCAPSSKLQSEALVTAGGRRYVDVAVMAPVHPALNMVPLLISGPHAEAVAPVLQALPMKLKIVPGDTGRASSIKMVRSVLIKGLEAVTVEMMLAAAAAGVEDEVLSSFEPNFPGFDWDAQSTVNMERMMVHGVRRAAEMVEVAKTLDDLGLDNSMSAACVNWHRNLPGTGVPAPKNPADTDATTLARQLLPHLRK